MDRGLIVTSILGRARTLSLGCLLGVAVMGVGVLAGCGESASNVGATADATLVPPHGGAFVKLGESGYGEVVVEVDPKANKSAPTQIVVYFFDKDGKTPLATAPSGVKVELVDPATGQMKMFDLSAKPKEKEKTGAPRFASNPLSDTFDDQISGTLIASVGASSFSESFVKRQ